MKLPLKAEEMILDENSCHNFTHHRNCQNSERKNSTFFDTFNKNLLEHMKKSNTTLKKKEVPRICALRIKDDDAVILDSIIDDEDEVQSIPYKRNKNVNSTIESGNHSESQTTSLMLDDSPEKSNLITMNDTDNNSSSNNNKSNNNNCNINIKKHDFNIECSKHHYIAQAEADENEIKHSRISAWVESQRPLRTKNQLSEDEINQFVQDSKNEMKANNDYLQMEYNVKQFLFNFQNANLNQAPKMPHRTETNL
jgi:hypothetical protein